MSILIKFCLLVSISLIAIALYVFLTLTIPTSITVFFGPVFYFRCSSLIRFTFPNHFKKILPTVSLLLSLMSTLSQTYSLDNEFLLVLVFCSINHLCYHIKTETGQILPCLILVYKIIRYKSFRHYTSCYIEGLQSITEATTQIYERSHPLQNLLFYLILFLGVIFCFLPASTCFISN